MFFNYLKISLRNLLKYRGYTFINTVSLSLGITFCMLVFLYVNQEMTFDNFHTEKNRIHSVLYHLVVPDYNIDSYGGAHVPAGPVILGNLPEVENFVRLWDYRDVVSDGTNSRKELLTFADSSLFRIFNFPLLYGDSSTALNRPDALVITEKTARRFFGGENPLGRTLTIRLGREFDEFTITAVAADIPPNSSIRFDFLLPFLRIKDIQGNEFFTDWSYQSAVTYLLLTENAEPAAVVSKFPEVIKNYLDTKHYQYELRTLNQIHLDPNCKLLTHLSGDITNSYILSAIAALVLLIACFNFINLSIGQSVGRATEIGVRKVVGALRSQLMVQFWMETLVLSFISLFLGIALAELFLPTFNSLTARELQLNLIDNPALLIAGLAVCLVTGLLAGGYPAVLLSGFEPVDILRNRFKTTGVGILNRSLVIIQFALCVFLIFVTVVMSRQIDFMKTKELGFNDKLLLSVEAVNVGDSQFDKKYHRKVIQNPTVLSMSATDASFTGAYMMSVGLPTGRPNESALMYRVDCDFVKTVGVNLKAGRDFSEVLVTDRDRAVLVNEKLVEVMGWEEPVGPQLRLPDREEPVTVVGVVKNFHVQSMRYALEPVILHISEIYPTRYFYVRISADNISSTLSFLKDTWQELAPQLPFEYHFVDEAFDRNYRAEERWHRIVRYSSIFAILIACLGLLGLSALMIYGRIKEVCIRKIHGASEISITSLLFKKFVIFVLPACVIGWPVGYLVMQKWLEHFAYRINIGTTGFIISGLVVLVVALLTVSYHTLKTAHTNPTEILRHE
ncbi:MAG: ABC transporter permease [candidate division Zixibacteria bacterium]|nr:ABC transporter permease [candidate division Zixibacteria bacterium]